MFAEIKDSDEYHLTMANIQSKTSIIISQKKLSSAQINVIDDKDIPKTPFGIYAKSEA